MRDLNQLNPDFRAIVVSLQKNAQRRGIDIRAFCTSRTPEEQARLWRQSRSGAEIRGKIAELRDQNAGYLADVLDGVGPQYGRHVTNAIPGLSWHQWREAVDFFWLVDGKACWSTRTRIVTQIGLENGYRVMAEEAVKLGLNPGGYWKRFKDWPHVQFRSLSVSKAFGSIQEVSSRMQKEWGLDPVTSPEKPFLEFGKAGTA